MRQVRISQSVEWFIFRRGEKRKKNFHERRNIGSHPFANFQCFTRELLDSSPTFRCVILCCNVLLWNHYVNEEHWVARWVSLRMFPCRRSHYECFINIYIKFGRWIFHSFKLLFQLCWGETFHWIVVERKRSSMIFPSGC